MYFYQNSITVKEELAELNDMFKMLVGICEEFKQIDKEKTDNMFLFFFNWDSPHARLLSHYETWSYKKKSTKMITGYRKSV